MRGTWLVIGILAAASGVCRAQEQEPAGTLVHEVVYNELHDHERHGFWQYWIEQHIQQNTRLEEQVETSDGPLTRLLRTNGRPLDERTKQEEKARLDRLMNSPREQAMHRQAFADDEKRIGSIVALLPDAFVYEYAGDQDGCLRLLFRPNPAYPPRTIESRIFHAMSGELWIDARLKRLVRLDGKLQENVDFGYGLLGRLNKGGWFRLVRTQVSATDWKTERLEIHISGRAMLFKTIGRETSEVRGGFAAVPAGMSLAQGMRILEQTTTQSTAIASTRVAPAAFTPRR